MRGEIKGEGEEGRSGQILHEVRHRVSSKCIVLYGVWSSSSCSLFRRDSCTAHCPGPSAISANHHDSKSPTRTCLATSHRPFGG